MKHNKLKIPFIVGIGLICSSCYNTYQLTTEPDFELAHVSVLSNVESSGYELTAITRGYEQTWSKPRNGFLVPELHHTDTFWFGDNYYSIFYRYEITSDGTGTAYVAECFTNQCTLDSSTCDYISNAYESLPKSEVRELSQGSQLALVNAAWLVPLLALLGYAGINKTLY